MMQFEREVHDDVYWDSNETGVTPRTGDPDEVIATWIHPGGDIGSLVFVAVPSHRDVWIFDNPDHQLTVTPQP